VPPLRERTEDLARLAGELLQELGQEHTGRTPPRLEADALAELGQWSWPGNVRELRTVLERALLASPDRVIRREDLERRRGLGEWHLTLGFPGPEGLRGTLQDVERQLIAEALARSATRQEAARRLQLSRYALARRMKALEIKG